MHKVYDQTEYDQYHFLTTTLEKEKAYWHFGVSDHYKHDPDKRYYAHIWTISGWGKYCYAPSPIEALSLVFKEYRTANVGASNG
jgi:hypothetical protein